MYSASYALTKLERLNFDAPSEIWGEIGGRAGVQAEADLAVAKAIEAEATFEKHLENNRELLEHTPAWELDYLRIDGKNLVARQAEERAKWLERYEEAIEREDGGRER